MAAIAYFAASVLVLSKRNIYDDELGSFGRIDIAWPRLWDAANRSDIHPPGMYLLGKVAYALFPDERWSVLIPIALVALGLGLFLAKALPAFGLRGRASIAVALACALTPELLLWTNSIRWYSWWTALALVVYALVLFPGGDSANRDGDNDGDGVVGSVPTPREIGPFALGLLLAIMLYVSYLTIPLVIALAAADMTARAPGERRKRALVWASAGGVLLVIGLPQLRVLLSVHLPRSAAQRGTVAASAVRFAYGVFMGETAPPWHPSAIARAALVIPLFVVGAVKSRERAPIRRAATFAGVMMVVAIVSGMGIKPRTFVVLAPFVVLISARGAIRLPTTPARARPLVGALILAAAFVPSTFVGIRNIVLRQGLGKTGLTDRVDEVPRAAMLMADNLCPDATCPVVVFSRDRGATYAVCLARLRQPRLQVLSFETDIPARLRCQATRANLPQSSSAPDSRQVAIYVETYLGSDRSLASRLQAFQSRFDAAAGTSLRLRFLSPDPDAPMKRRLSSLFPESADLPDYRFILHAASMRGNVDDLARQWIDLPRGLGKHAPSSGP